MGGGAEVAVPERFGLDVFVAEGAEELASVGVGGGWVVYSPRSALLAEEGADIGHVEARCAAAVRGWMER